MANPLPHLEPVLIATFRNLGGANHPERFGDLAVERRTFRTSLQVRLDVHRRTGGVLAVVVQNQRLFAVVLHVSLRSGSRATRSLGTGRDPPCLGAAVPRPSILPISSIDRPS